MMDKNRYLPSVEYNGKTYEYKHSKHNILTYECKYMDWDYDEMVFRTDILIVEYRETEKDYFLLFKIHIGYDGKVCYENLSGRDNRVLYKDNKRETQK